MATLTEHENKRYSEDNHCQIRLEEKIVFKYLKQVRSRPPSGELLDIGCGSGAVCAEIQKLGYEVTGADISKTAVAKARARNIKADVVNLDEGLPYKDSRFSVVVAGDIIEHVYDPLYVLKEAARVLNNKGWIIIPVPSDPSFMVRLKTLFGVSYQEVMYRRSGYYKHHTFFTLRLLRFMLKTAGFKITEQQRVTNIGHWYQFNSPITPLIFTNELAVLARKTNTFL